MSNPEFDGFSDHDWEEKGDLAWNEFDWERYLREQDSMIVTYLKHYETLQNHPERIDEAAHLMGWDQDYWTSDGADDDDERPAVEEDRELELDLDDFDLDPYTLHKNPIFIATKAIYFSLKRAWENLARDPQKAPPVLALPFFASLHTGEEQAVLAIQALDMGDYAMGISLFKRALRELNQSFAILDDANAARYRGVAAYRAAAFPRLFDLREIWLRVMNECRGELGRRIDGEN